MPQDWNLTQCAGCGMVVPRVSAGRLEAALLDKRARTAHLIADAIRANPQLFDAEGAEFTAGWIERWFGSSVRAALAPPTPDAVQEG